MHCNSICNEVYSISAKLRGIVAASFSRFNGKHFIVIDRNKITELAKFKKYAKFRELRRKFVNI